VKQGGEEIRLLDRSEYEEWHALLEESAAEPLFSTEPWVDRLAKAFGGEAEVLGRFEGGVLVGGIALPVRKRGGISIATSPYLLPYFPIVSRANLRRILQLLLPEITRRYSLVSLMPSPVEADIRTYLHAGWNAAYRYSSRLPLVGETADSILARLEPVGRKRVRKLAKEGLEWRLGEDAAIHRTLMWASYARHGEAPPYSEKVAARIHRELLGSGSALLFELLRGDDVVSTHMVGIDSKRAYSLESGTDPEGGRKGEAIFLMVHLLVELARRGVAEHDFGGVNHPTISRFKEAFGGELVRYHVVVPPRPLWLRLLMRMKGIPSELENHSSAGNPGR